jgi:ABC-2 type transport system ATP-binding protein
LTLTASPAPELQALAGANVTALAVREPSLEENFLDCNAQQVAR